MILQFIKPIQIKKSYESMKILYTSYLRLILLNGCKTQSTTKGIYQSIINFERKVLRKMYGPLIIKKWKDMKKGIIMNYNSYGD